MINTDQLVTLPWDHGSQTLYETFQTSLGLAIESFQPVKKYTEFSSQHSWVKNIRCDRLPFLKCLLPALEQIFALPVSRQALELMHSVLISHRFTGSNNFICFNLFWRFVVVYIPPVTCTKCLKKGTSSQEILCDLKGLQLKGLPSVGTHSSSASVLTFHCSTLSCLLPRHSLHTLISFGVKSYSKSLLSAFSDMNHKVCHRGSNSRTMATKGFLCWI